MPFMSRWQAPGCYFGADAGSQTDRNHDHLRLRQPSFARDAKKVCVRTPRAARLGVSHCKMSLHNIGRELSDIAVSYDSASIQNCELLGDGPHKLQILLNEKNGAVPLRGNPLYYWLNLLHYGRL